MRTGQPLAVALIALLNCLPLSAAEQPRVDFARDVQPILKTRCYSCHDGRKHKAGLRLDVRSSALRGGESGKPAIVRGDSKKSDLLRRVTTNEDEEVMPPAGERLTAIQVKLLREWIDSGAVWPDALAGEDMRGKNHWAFKAPVRPPLPAVHRANWPRNPLDRFVLARLEKESLKPSPQADRVTLIRRLSLDLIGLPPTLAEVDAFLADKSEQAYEKVVERLLPQPALRRALGPASGSTPLATPTAMASRKTNRGKSGSIAIGSSTPSTAICPTINSSSSRSPAICCRTRRKIRRWQRVSCAIR